ncbi:response regulator [Nitrospira sp. Nam80]
MSIKILLADDHPLVRQGVRTILQAEGDISIAGETGDGLEVVPLTESLRPDIILLDLMIPSISGLEVTRQITKRIPRVKVIVLSMYSTEAYVLEALRNGAAGYVLKSASMDELIKAVREVTAGRHYLSPPLSETIIEAYVKKTDSSAIDPYETLTSREREVLHLVVSGHSTINVAAKLFISPRTVETHRSNLMRKLSLNSQTDLVLYAVRRGIVPAER